MKTREWEWLPPAGEIAGATYVESGHLLYAQEGSLYALPVDLSRKVFTGAPIPLLNDVYTKVVSDAIVAQFSVSSNGVLSYVSGHAPEWELVRVNAAGGWQPLGNLRRSFRYPRLSPDSSNPYGRRGAGNSSTGTTTSCLPSRSVPDLNSKSNPRVCCFAAHS